MMNILNSDIVKFLIPAAAGIAVVIRYVLIKRGRNALGITITLAVLATAAAGIFVGPKLHRFITRDYYTAFHYYVGGKYFSELGYYKLYRFCALADKQTGTDVLGDVGSITRLEDYGHISKAEGIAQARAELDSTFSAERWEEFKRDWRALARLSPPSVWRGRLNDRGYNPPPFWTIIPGALSQVISAEDNIGYRLLRLTDLFSLLAITALLGFWVGLDSALLVFIFIVTALYNDSRQINTILQFMWLFTLIPAAAVYRRKPGVSGALLAASANLRVFPGLLAVGPAISWLAQTVADKKPPRRESAFLAAFAIAGVLFFAAGLTRGAGVSSTAEFVGNITTHKEDQKFDYQKVGLARTMAENFADPFEKRRDFKLPADRFHKKLPIYYGLILALLGLMAFGAIKGKSSHWLLPQGIAAVFAAVVLSRYYYLALAIFLVPPKTEQNKPTAIFAAAYIMLLHAVLYLLGSQFAPPLSYEKNFGVQAAYTLLNFGILFFLIVFPPVSVFSGKNEPPTEAD